MHRTLRAKSGNGARGQSLAEFALVLPILVLVIAAIIQFGIIFWGQNTLTQVARDTGRWAASQVTCSAADVAGTASAIAAQSSLIGYTANEWSTGSANWSAAWTDSTGTALTSANCPPTSNQQVDWVTITLNHRVPIFFPWVPGSGNLTTTTRFRMEPIPQ